MAEIFNSNLFDSFTPKASDMDEYQKHLVDSMKEAADTSILKVDCREKADKVKINKDTLKLIKEKRKLRRQYAKQKLPSTKSSINKLRKEINQKLNKETNTRWEKFCSSVSLEKDPAKSWCRIKNLSYTNTGQQNRQNQCRKSREVFAESVERHFGIECNNFDDTKLGKSTSL